MSRGRKGKEAAMKKIEEYATPELEIIGQEDILTTSRGTETPIINSGYGEWEW